MNDITQTEYNNPSDVLIELIEQFSNLENNRARLIQSIVNRAKQENIDPAVIRKLIEDKLKARGLSDSTIRRSLPNELKHLQMVRQKPKQSIEFKTTELINPSVDDLRQTGLTEPIINNDSIINGLINEGFNFNKPFEVWKDSYKEIANELVKQEDISKTIVVFFQEI